MMRERATASRGFTLLEMLIALALTSMILAGLYSAFFLSQRAREEAEASLTKLQECRTALDIMRRELDALVYDATNTATLFTVADGDFYGKQASRLTFTTLSPHIPGLSTVSYYVEEREGRLTLLKKLSGAYGIGHEGKGEEVIEDIEHFALEVNDNGIWTRVWDAAEAKHAPSEIKVTLTAAADGKSISVFETIRPKIGRRL